MASTRVGVAFDVFSLWGMGKDCGAMCVYAAERARQAQVVAGARVLPLIPVHSPRTLTDRTSRPIVSGVSRVCSRNHVGRGAHRATRLRDKEGGR